MLARFAAERVASLATLSAAGPRLVPVTFAWHDGAAVWAVDRVKPKRPGPLRRERDLAADPRVAMLVDHYEEDWTALWWVELQGTAATLAGRGRRGRPRRPGQPVPPLPERPPAGPGGGRDPAPVGLVVGQLIRSKCTNQPGDRVYLHVGGDMLGWQSNDRSRPVPAGRPHLLEVAMSSAVVDFGVDPLDPPATGAFPEPLEVRPEDEVAVQRVEQWFRDYAQSRDPVLRERIILAYLGLADRLAERYRSNRAVSLEDLRQVARLGLVKAVDRYQPERANPFIPYAVATVVGELKRHLRDASWRLRVPRGTKDLALRLCRAIDELPQQLGHSPTVPELAEYLGTSMEEVLEAIEVAQTRSAPSLDQPAGEDGEAVLGDFVVDRRHREELEDLLVLPQLIGRLPERERQIVLLRYVEELTQDEIAARMGISQMHVSRLLRRAIERMRGQLVDS